jgi:hypothetical protein
MADVQGRCSMADVQGAILFFGESQAKSDFATLPDDNDTKHLGSIKIKHLLKFFNNKMTFESPSP